MESLIERFEAGLNLDEPSLETNSPPSSPSPEAVPDDLEERSATCSQEPDPECFDETWENFVKFMDTQAAVKPYPKFLYRAHVHGHPFPRFIDEVKNEYADTFISEFHAWARRTIHSEIDTSILLLGSIVDVLEELSRHLQKTQICLNDSEYLSRMVSLSEDFLWTTHRLCEVGKKANEDQIPGLAIFDVERIRKTVKIWRVSDMFEFLDVLKESKVAMGRNPMEVPEYVRQWSSNAKEYVCWGYIPRTALLSFGKLSDLTPSGLLNLNFTSSIHLGNFRQYPTKLISPDEYKARASAFLRAAVVVPLCLEKADAKSIANQLMQSFHNPWFWGYRVTGFAEDMEDLMTGLRDALIRQIKQKSFLLLLHQKDLLLDYEVALQQIW